MTTALSEACADVPFSNGTEGEAWMSNWCDFCAHDHDQHEGATVENTGGCIIVSLSMLGDLAEGGWKWPEAWLPEPDDGSFSLPSRLICKQFTPCEHDACTGDPGTEARAERVREVEVYWRDRNR